MPASLRRLSRLAVLALAACGAAPRPTPAPPRTEPPPAPAVLDVTRTGGDLAFAGNLPDGARAFLVGGVRVLVRGARAETAEHVVAEGLVAAVEHEDGWRFADARGSLWRAPSFLGPLEHAGDLGARLFTRTASRGVIAVLARNRTRALLVSDGAGPARLAADFPVLAASFLDARRGLVVADGGRLFRTEDGGRAWLPVTGAGPFRGVEPAAQDGWLARSGPESAEVVSLVSPAGAVAPAPEAAGLDADTMQAALLAIASVDLPHAGTLVGDRVFDHLGRSLLEMARGGGALAWRGDVLPDAGCELAGWGERLLASCPTGLFVRAGDRFERVAGTDEAPHPALVASEDGRSLAWLDAAQQSVVVLDVASDRRLSRVVLDAASARLDAVHGTVVLGRALGTSEGYRLVELDGGGEADPGAPERVTEARITAAGDVLLAGYAGASPVVRTGPVEGPWRAVALPEGARAAAMADARGGFAIGATAADLWLTGDGGRSWSPLELGPPEETRLLSLEGELAGARPVWCDAGRCVATEGVFGLRVGVTGYGEPAVLRHTLRASAAEIPVEPQPPTAEPFGRLLGCTESASAGARAPARPRAGGFVTPEGGRGSVALRAGRLALSWQGADERGSYRARATGAPSQPLAEQPGAPTATVLAASRGAWLGSLCVGEVCEGAFAPAGGRIETFTSPVLWHDGRGFVFLPLPGGRVLTVLGGGAESRVLAFAAGATGPLRELRTPDAQDTGLGLDAGAPVLVARTPSGRWRLYPLEGDGPPRALPIEGPALPVCSGPAPAETLSVRFPAGPRLGEQASSAAVDLSGSVACIRSVVLQPPDGSTPGARGVLRATTDGRLEGTLVRRVAGATSADPPVEQAPVRVVCRIVG